MSRVVACYKWVLDEADISIGDDGSVDLGRAKGKISEYDRNAIAEACDIAAQIDGGVPVGLTFGAEDSRPALKDALSRGLDETVWVKGACAEKADGLLTASAIAAGIRKLGDVDVVVCAEGASDTFARQTAPRIAAALDIPVVTSVMDLEVKDGGVEARRRLDGCIQTVNVEFPVVLGILPEAIDAPIPGLKAIMAAKKKPVQEWDASELLGQQSPAVVVTGTKGCTVDRKCIRIEEDTSEGSAKALVAALRKEGVL